MTSPRRAEYRIPCDDERQVARLVRSLTVEADGAPPRTKVDVKAEGSTLLVVIDAEDTRGLRAATNSYLRWVNTALEVDRIGGGMRARPE